MSFLALKFASLKNTKKEYSDHSEFQSFPVASRCQDEWFLLPKAHLTNKHGAAHAVEHLNVFKGFFHCAFP